MKDFISKTSDREFELDILKCRLRIDLSNGIFTNFLYQALGFAIFGFNACTCLQGITLDYFVFI